ncbi:hypothetical protein M0813_17361 [Anaeramoeba flamelloides]|uniref:Store-operated calcium entry-associated regulatory factor n=1 Tax=Anaeramoeba flamelloides TaxID=1746091 RepID=A0AAV8AHU9_9EUKA|nr:hypothetical protein M0812_04274 [Anaeramoeba flamelloides]KAJ6248628.1 hypothetical protein M0813_17361 [Anaeramoeba flamelloides]
MPHLIYFILFFFLSSNFLVQSHFEAVYINDIKKLTFQQNTLTASRRSSPIFQITCIDDGPIGCPHEFIPKEVVCTNSGIIEDNVQWECDAILDPQVTFLDVFVSCEGFRYKNDKYVLSGSCGVNFVLNWLIEPAHYQQEPIERDAILLSKIQSLTFKSGAFTNSRRTKSEPNLICMGGNFGCVEKYLPQSVTCNNRGSNFDNENVIWECNSNIDHNLQLSDTKVLCEGYRSPNDQYILDGSCVLEYKLHYKNNGISYLPTIDSISFYSGEETIPVRLEPTYQMTIRNEISPAIIPTQVNCYNVDKSDNIINDWVCEHNGDGNYIISSPEILCEGYNSRNDPFIKRKSCSIVYDLLPFSDYSGPNMDYYQYNHEHRYDDAYDTKAWKREAGPVKIGKGFGILIIIALIGMVFCCLRPKTNNPRKTYTSVQKNNNKANSVSFGQTSRKKESSISKRFSSVRTEGR